MFTRTNVRDIMYMVIRMKQLYIDFDGVILDTITYPYEYVEKELGLEINSENMGKFYRELDWNDFLKKMPIINDSLDCIQKIIDSNRFEVNILTHVTSLDEAYEKVQYIRQFFKDIKIIPTPRKISKTKMVAPEGAILIDDFCGNLKEWTEAGGVGVRFSTKLSSKGYPVIDRLDQILNLGLAG